MILTVAVGLKDHTWYEIHNVFAMAFFRNDYPCDMTYAELLKCLSDHFEKIKGTPAPKPPWPDWWDERDIIENEMVRRLAEHFYEEKAKFVFIHVLEYDPRA